MLLFLCCDLLPATRLDHASTLALLALITGDLLPVWIPDSMWGMLGLPSAPAATVRREAGSGTWNRSAAAASRHIVVAAAATLGASVVASFPPAVVAAAVSIATGDVVAGAPQPTDVATTGCVVAIAAVVLLTVVAALVVATRRRQQQDSVAAALPTLPRLVRRSRRTPLRGRFEPRFESSVASRRTVFGSSPSLAPGGAELELRGNGT